MFNFPFFRFPYYNYYPYYSNYIKKNIANSNTNVCNNYDIYNNYKMEKKENKIQEKINKKISSKYNSFGPISFINPFVENFDENSPVLEILGLKLYLDDIIILSLLFLLYKEDVQDEILFLVLVLLLLT